MTKVEIGKVCLGILAGSLIVSGTLCAVFAIAANHKSAAYHSAANPAQSEDKNKIDPNMPEWGPYMAKMQKTVKAAWSPPISDAGTKTVVTYRINRDGKISDIKVMQSSGYSKADASAVETLRHVSPLEPLPEKFKGDYVKVQFTFEYNVQK